MKRIGSSLKTLRGIGFTDLVVSLVVASIMAIIFYNVYSRLQISKKEKSVDLYMEQNTDKAMKSIIEDVTNSLMYGSWCSRNRLIQVKDGGTGSSDEMTILTGLPSSAETLKEDMIPDTYEIPVNIKNDYTADQKLAICDETDIEWFTVKGIDPDKDRFISFIRPFMVNNEPPFTKIFLKDAVVGAFEKVSYFIHSSSDRKTAIYRKTFGSNNAELLARGIENLQVEFTKEDASTSSSEPFIPPETRQVKISLIAISEKEDESYSGFHSLTGFPDGHKRLKVTANISFFPLDRRFLDGISYKISWDAKTGKPKPAFFKNTQ